MTPDERQLLGGLFDRIRESSQGQQRDAEAEAFINNAIKAQPYAPYMMAQAVIVQDETLKGAVQKIEELEAKVRELETRAPAPQQAASGGFLGGIGRSVFGGGGQPAAPQAAPGGFSRSGVPSTSGISVPPPPGGPQYGQAMGAQPMGQQPMGQQPMGQQGGPWQQPQQQGGGSSFLKGALGAAAGVAGGMLLANAVSGMFRGDSSANAAAGQKQVAGGDNTSSSLEKDGAWGNQSKSASGDNWDSASSSGSSDNWDSASSSGSSDNWDSPSNVSGDNWDNSSSGDSGGDSWSDE